MHPNALSILVLHPQPADPLSLCALIFLQEFSSAWRQLSNEHTRAHKDPSRLNRPLRLG